MSLPAVSRVPSTLARQLAALVLAGLSLAAATGCTKKVIAAAPAPVPLAVPVVPPRLVGPVQVTDEERPQPVAEAPAAPAQRSQPRPPRIANRPAETPPEAAPDEAQRARAEGAEPAAPVAGPLLRTRETANDAEAVKKVRDVLTRAEQNLAKVNLRALTANGRAQAETARRFIVQAGDALDRRQLTFALSLADKAEQLSTSLANR